MAGANEARLPNRVATATVAQSSFMEIFLAVNGPLCAAAWKHI